MRYHERPIDRTDIHTADLPVTALSDRNLPATAWLEVSPALLTLGDHLPERSPCSRSASNASEMNSLVVERAATRVGAAGSAAPHVAKDRWR